MPKLPYTKAQLESIVCAQLENLEHYGELIELLKQQNQLIRDMSAKLKADLHHVQPYKQAQRKARRRAGDAPA